MQPGGWCGDGSALVGINSLVPLGVGGLIRPRDIGRERDVSVLFDRLVDGDSRVELHHPGASLRRRKDFRLEIVSELDDPPRLQLAPGMDHRLPHRFAYWPQQKNL